MEFLYNVGDWAIFGNSLPFKQVKQILNYSDDVESNNAFTLSKEFRYSYDYENWSIWNTLTTPNLNTVNTLEFNFFTNSDIIDNWNQDEVWGISFNNGEKWKVKQDSPSPFLIKFSDNIIYEKGEILNAGFFTVLNGPRTISEISYFDTNKPKEFWIQYKYTLLTGSNVFINSVELEIEENSINLYNCKTLLKPLDCGSGTSLIINSCNEPYQFNEHNGLLKNLFLDINSMVASIAGLNVQWFKFNPVLNSEDVLFHEWTLYEVESPKYIQIVIPGGKMPDSKPIYNPYDIDFEMPFEVHISKTTWESIYGLTIPQKRDIVWIEQTNKVWEVSSSYLQREFNNIGVYYKVFLTKYQPRNNAIKSADVEKMLDDKIFSQEEAFNELLNIEIDKIQKPELNTDDNIFDDMRNFVNTKVINSKILNYYTTISKSHYDLSYELNNTGSNVYAVQYHKPNLWSKKENRAFSFWFKIQEPIAEKTKIDTIESLGNNLYNLQGVILRLEHGQKIKIWNSDSSISFILECIINQDLTIDYVASDFWNNYLSTIDLSLYTGYSWCYHHDNNFIYNSSVSIDIEYAHVISLLKIKLNSSTYEIMLDMDESLTEEWMGLFINVSNEFKIIETNLYKIQWNIETDTPKTNKLLSIINNNTIIVPEKYTSTTYWEIKKSQMYLTNIRLWNTICQVELQSKILNQYIPENNDLLIISDIANEQTHLPLL